MSAVYDAGLLIAADRNDRDVWADHRARLEVGVVPRTTAPVVAQVSRSPQQVQLRRLLRGCDIVGFAPEQAHEVGELLGRSETTDVVDAHVVLTASEAGAIVYTSDEENIEQLSKHLPQPIGIRRVSPRRREPKRRRS
jgi:predicted nucleic acid-binding protein